MDLLRGTLDSILRNNHFFAYIIENAVKIPKKHKERPFVSGSGLSGLDGVKRNSAFARRKKHFFPSCLLAKSGVWGQAPVLIHLSNNTKASQYFLYGSFVLFRIIYFSVSEIY